MKKVMRWDSVTLRLPASVRGKYCAFRGENGASLVVVQDPAVKVSGLAMSVRTGMFHDPENFDGMAHFCEHMLFNGSEDFPGEGEFQRFVGQNSGSYNAFTTETMTTFYGKVADESFDGLVRRFLPFFTSPLFNQNCVSREVMAVDSEDVRNNSVDGWRFREVINSQTNPKHPRFKYGCGNRHTLNASESELLTKEVRQFHKKNYYAAGMSLAVYSPRSVEEILSLVTPYLEKLPVGPSTPAKFEFLALEDQVYPGGSWLNFLSQRAGRSLSMFFEVNCPHSSWRTLPSAYISHILGHECDASVLGVLQQRGLASAMMVGPSYLDDNRELFKVSIELTLDGMAKLEEVVDLVFYGIGSAIPGNQIDEEVYNSMKAELKLSFESSEVQSASDQCTELCSGVLDRDLENCFPMNFPLQDDLEESLNYVKQLTPERCTFILKWDQLPVEDTADGDKAEMDPEAEKLFLKLPQYAQIKANQKAKFSRASFGIRPIPPTLLTKWRQCLQGLPAVPEGLALPPRNPFIASDLTIYIPDAVAWRPQKISSAHGVIYVRKDDGHHNSFMASLKITLLSPVTYISPLHRFYTKVMIRILEEQTRELRYAGELASLSNNVESRKLGLSMLIAGPEEHLFSFAIRVLQNGLNKEVLLGTETSYDIHALHVRQAIENHSCRTAYQIAMDKLWEVLSVVSISDEELLSAIPTATYSGYCEFIHSYLTAGFLFEAFVAGNVKSLQDIRSKFVDPLEAHLKVFPVPPLSLLPPVRDGFEAESTAKKLPPLHKKEVVTTSVDMIYHPAFLKGNKNVSVLMAVCVGRTTPRISALTNCVKALLSSSFFQALRTDETLGYVVSCSGCTYLQDTHMYFLVESGKENVDALYLLSRIIAYLSAVEETLDTICSEESVNEVFKSAVLNLQQRPLSVTHDSIQLESEYFHPVGFSIREKQIEVIQTLSAVDVKEFMRQNILNGRQQKPVVLVVDRWREPTNDTRAEWCTPGYHRAKLPPYQKVSQDSEEASKEDKEMTLPTFDTTNSDMEYVVDIDVKANRKEYQEGLTVAEYTNRFRDVS